MTKQHKKLVLYIAKVTPMIICQPLALLVVTMIFFSCNNLLFYLGYIALLMLLLQLGTTIIKLKYYRIIITNKSLVIRSGLLNKNTSEYLLSHISGINCYQSYLGRLCGYGKISLVVSGVVQPALVYIDTPMLFARELTIASMDFNSYLYTNSNSFTNNISAVTT